MKYAYRLEGGFVTKNEVVSETEATITFRPDPKSPNYILKERKITNDHQWFDEQLWKMPSLNSTFISQK